VRSQPIKRRVEGGYYACQLASVLCEVRQLQFFVCRFLITLVCGSIREYAFIVHVSVWKVEMESHLIIVQMHEVTFHIEGR
jgi:hypothetical protein